MPFRLTFNAFGSSFSTLPPRTLVSQNKCRLDGDYGVVCSALLSVRAVFTAAKPQDQGQLLTTVGIITPRKLSARRRWRQKAKAKRNPGERVQ